MRVLLLVFLIKQSTVSPSTYLVSFIFRIFPTTHLHCTALPSPSPLGLTALLWQLVPQTSHLHHSLSSLIPAQDDILEMQPRLCHSSIVTPSHSESKPQSLQGSAGCYGITGSPQPLTADCTSCRTWPGHHPCCLVP